MDMSAAASMFTKKVEERDEGSRRRGDKQSNEVEKDNKGNVIQKWF